MTMKVTNKTNTYNYIICLKLFKLDTNIQSRYMKITHEMEEKITSIDQLKELEKQGLEAYHKA